jgi:predicted PurR-regulated permease PerM
MRTPQEELKARKHRAIFVNISASILFFAVAAYLLNAMQPIVLPAILGVFLAYVFKPLVSFRGSPVRKYVRAAVLISIVTTLGYVGIKFVRDSLPSEKEKLELLVRLQFRLNERYKSWMGLAEKPEGNIVYKMAGKELGPALMKMNDFLSLTPEQRKLFLLYRKGHNDEPPVSDRYFEYYLSNLKIIKEVEVEREVAAHIAAEKATEDAKENTGTIKKESGGLAHFMKLFSIWLVFPLTFMFILTDKGQIISFLMKLVPNRYFELTMNVVDHVDDALGKYIRGTAIECALVAISLIIGFWICGLPLKISILIGILGGLTNAIPFVGTLIACAVGAAYSLIAEDISPLIPFVTENNLLIAVIAVVMIAHLLDNAIYQPLVVGGAVNIHPLVVILGVFGGSTAFGFPGLLLAIPTIVIVKVVVEQLFRGLKEYKII